jgi:lipid II:glycine glycyltransferase (peptidoglycan interpeptide bridge formation enzyme)
MEIRNFGSGKRGVSLPFSDYCDPLLGKNVPVQKALDIVFAHGKGKGWTSLELRTTKNLPAEIHPTGFYFHHVLDITGGEENLFSRFRSSNQRNIRKASREGVVVQLQSSLEAVRQYYVLHCGTRKMHGLPSQPFSFFRNIQKHILSKGNGFVALASYRGESIAGGIYIHSGKNAVFKFGASERRYQGLRANNLIMWEAIRWYSRNGFKDFSFGRTDPENEGLRNYKNAWGSEERGIVSFHYDFVNKKYCNKKKWTHGMHNKIIHHLPIAVSKKIGIIFYKYID